MKKKVWFPVAAVFAALILTACFKDKVERCTPNTLARDRQIIDSILGSEAASYTFDNENALYYRIENSGSGDQLTTGDSLVAFKYVGRILNGFGDGAIVDSLTINPPATNTLNYYGSLIGLSYALQKVKEGGAIRVIIPSSRLFGCEATNGVNPVPANSQLIYQYNLTDVKKP